MNKTVNVLIFPAGEVNSVELHDALATTVNIKVYGASSVDRHGPYLFKNYIDGVPFISNQKFVPEFNELLKKYNIDVIFPTHDTVATFLVNNQEKICAKVIAGTKDTALVCRDKRVMYERFSDCDFVPRVFHNVQEVTTFPVFTKPRHGQGSVGVRKIAQANELEGIDFSEDVVSEFLPGTEYTVDCLTDKDGVLKVVSPRSRDRTLGGISVSGQVRPLTPEIEIMAQKINERLEFAGLWFFQIKQDKGGRFKLLEISTRCAGTMCLTRARGINLPLLSVYVAMGYDVDVFANDYQVQVDRTLINRYKINYDYDVVYFDFDDTLIVNEQVNLYAVMFLYQCKNHGKKVYLLTKHVQNIEDTLAHYGIDKSLFTRITHLKADEHKVDEMQPGRAIFVDNAFQERKRVYDTFKIPVFDVEGIEVLLDWRT